MNSNLNENTVDGKSESMHILLYYCTIELLPFQIFGTIKHVFKEYIIMKANIIKIRKPNEICKYNIKLSL